MILDDKYRLHSGISNSLIKDFVNKGPKVFFDTYIDPLRPEQLEWSTESTDIGDLCDCLLTTPDLFDKFYYISGDVKVSPAQRSILDAARLKAIKAACLAGLSAQDALKHPAVNKIFEAGPFLLTAAREYRDPAKNEEEAKKGYQANYKDDTMIKHLIEIGHSYYSDLSIAAGRKILDQTTYNVAEAKKREALADENISKFFTEKPADGIEIKNQYMLVSMINGVEVKILLDYVRFDHKNKVITPKDVKTSLSRVQFKANYEKFGYGNQGSFYTGVLQHAFPDYKVEPFDFIVLFTDTKEDPMIYKMSQMELDIHRDGVILKSGRVITGWMKALDDILWHTNTSQWRYPRNYYDKGYQLIDSYNAEAVDSMAEADPDIF